MRDGIWSRLALSRIGRAVLLGLGAVAMLSASNTAALSQISLAQAPLFTAIDIDPTRVDWAGRSAAHSISGGQEVGWGQREQWGMDIDALLWQSNTSGVYWVKLHPIGFISSKAYGTAGGEQVGVGFTGDHDHALLWHGTAASVLDLHAFLPPGFVSSSASSIDAAGNIVGVATTGSEQWSPSHAILWKRNVPEPGTSRGQNTKGC